MFDNSQGHRAVGTLLISIYSTTAKVAIISSTSLLVLELRRVMNFPLISLTVKLAAFLYLASYSALVFQTSTAKS